jgi:hypothetical protein
VCSRFRQGLDPKAVAFQNRFFQHLQLNLGMGKLSLSIRSHSPAGPHSILRKGSLITRNPPLPRMDYLSDTGIDQVLTPSSAEVRLALVWLNARLARTCIIPHPQQTCLCTAMEPRCAGVDMLKPASAAVARPQGCSSRTRETGSSAVHGCGGPRANHRPRRVPPSISLGAACAHWSISVAV